MMGKMFAAIEESAAPFDGEDQCFKIYRGMSRNELVDSDFLAEGITERIEVSGDSVGLEAIGIVEHIDLLKFRESPEVLIDAIEALNQKLH